MVQAKRFNRCVWLCVCVCVCVCVCACVLCVILWFVFSNRLTNLVSVELETLAALHAETITKLVRLFRGFQKSLWYTSSILRTHKTVTAIPRAFTWRCASSGMCLSYISLRVCTFSLGRLPTAVRTYKMPTSCCALF